MKKFTLKRIVRDTTNNLGVLLHDGIPIATTIEPPWRMNERSISCIPDGSYQCKRIISPKFGDTFEIKDVHNRDSILFHAGNYVEDTYGCIILGSFFTQRQKQRQKESGVGNSRIAFNAFMKIVLDIDEFQISIQNVY